MGGTVGSAPQRKGSLKQGRAFAVPSVAGGRRHAQRLALCCRRQANGAGRSSPPSWWSALRIPLLPGRLARLITHLCCRWCCKTHPTSIRGFQQVGSKVIGLLASSAGPRWLLVPMNPGQRSPARLQMCSFISVLGTDVSEVPSHSPGAQAAAAAALSVGSGENTFLWTPPKVRESKDCSVLAMKPGLVLSLALLCLTPASKSLLGSAF